MARKHGRFSQLYVAITSAGSAAPLLHTATVDQSYTTDQAETTAFGDTIKQYVVGLPDATTTYSGFPSDTASTGLIEAALDGLDRAWYFYPFGGTTPYTYGRGFADFGFSTDVAGAVKMSGKIVPSTAIGRIGF